MDSTFNKHNLKGKWWEYIHDTEALLEYINKQEELIDDLEKNLTANTDYQKIEILTEFFRNCAKRLSEKETIVLFLKFSGYSYQKIEQITKTLNLSDSAAQRHVGKAITKLNKFFQKDIHEKF